MIAYPVAEIFTSIQGEGHYVGTPAVFIRLHGCNLRCAFCDTNTKPVYTLTVNSLIGKLGVTNIPTVVLTGGEPTIHPIQPLIERLRDENFCVHIETNGAPTKYSEALQAADWVTVSPKTSVLSKYAYQCASEVKILVGVEAPDWKQVLETVQCNTYKRVELFLQPIWGPNIEKNTALAVEEVLKNPDLRLSVQLHKLLNLK